MGNCITPHVLNNAFVTPSRHLAGECRLESTADRNLFDMP